MTAAERDALRVFVWKVHTSRHGGDRAAMAIYDAVQAMAPGDPIKELLRCFVGPERLTAIVRFDCLLHPPTLTFADAAAHRCVSVFGRRVICTQASYDTLSRRDPASGLSSAWSRIEGEGALCVRRIREVMTQGKVALLHCRQNRGQHPRRFSTGQLPPSANRAVHHAGRSPPTRRPRCPLGFVLRKSTKRV
mgnify:FL=1